MIFLRRLFRLFDAPMAIVLGSVFAILLVLHLGTTNWAASKRERQSKNAAEPTMVALRKPAHDLNRRPVTGARSLERPAVAPRRNG